MRENGPLGLHKGRDFSIESQTILQRSCVEDVVQRLKASSASAFVCSRAVFTNKALVAKVNRFPRSSSSLGLLDSRC